MDRDAANNPVGPLNPVGRDGQVEIRDPPDIVMHMSAEEADISGIRLLDAAAAARRRRDGRRAGED